MTFSVIVNILTNHNFEIKPISKKKLIAPQERVKQNSGIKWQATEDRTVKNVLIIDDYVDIVESVKLLLENNGYNVITAFDSREGYRKIIEDRPDIVLLDIILTTEDEGIKLAHKLRNDPALSLIPVFVLTSVRKDSTEEVSKLPIEGYLEKPVKPEQLLSALRDVLHKTV